MELNFTNNLFKSWLFGVLLAPIAYIFYLDAKISFWTLFIELFPKGMIYSMSSLVVCAFYKYLFRKFKITFLLDIVIMFVLIRVVTNVTFHWLFFNQTGLVWFYVVSLLLSYILVILLNRTKMKEQVYK